MKQQPARSLIVCGIALWMVGLSGCIVPPPGDRGGRGGRGGDIDRRGDPRGDVERRGDDRRDGPRDDDRFCRPDEREPCRDRDSRP